MVWQSRQNGGILSTAVTPLIQDKKFVHGPLPRPGFPAYNYTTDRLSIVKRIVHRHACVVYIVTVL